MSAITRLVDALQAYDAETDPVPLSAKLYIERLEVALEYASQRIDSLREEANER